MRLRLAAWTIFIACVATPAAFADSLWGAGVDGDMQSLYGRTSRSLGLGDIVTIQIVENLSAKNESDIDTQKEGTKELKLNGLTEIPIPLGLDSDIRELFGTAIATDPSFKLESTSDFTGEGETNRSARVTGTVSAQVVEVAENGTLRIEATQAVHINEELNTVVLTGSIRPEDVRADNSVLSTRIANAEIFYTGRGPLSNTGKRGILTELWEYLWPF